LEADFVPFIKEILLSTNASAKFIEIEITETVLLTEIELIVEKMNQLRELGFRFAIDDFGKGYSSFSYLCDLPVSTLKIDQSFTENLVENKSQQIVVSSIISMAKQLQLSVVVEGIETETQHKLLKKLGCSQFQGYFVGVPIAKKEFQMLLLKKTKPEIENKQNEKQG
jgi:EAL domain-containing protein (putative c-di-GMP-specific phosphodiesterase class I)